MNCRVTRTLCDRRAETARSCLRAAYSSCITHALTKRNKENDYHLLAVGGHSVYARLDRGARRPAAPCTALLSRHAPKVPRALPEQERQRAARLGQHGGVTHAGDGAAARRPAPRPLPLPVLRPALDGSLLVGDAREPGPLVMRDMVPRARATVAGTLPFPTFLSLSASPGDAHETRTCSHNVNVATPGSRASPRRRVC